MAALTFQRAAWRLQVSKSSNTLSVSFSTALPHGRSGVKQSSTRTGTREHEQPQSTRHFSTKSSSSPSPSTTLPTSKSATSTLRRTVSSSKQEPLSQQHVRRHHISTSPSHRALTSSSRSSYPRTQPPYKTIYERAASARLASAFSTSSLVSKYTSYPDEVPLTTTRNAPTAPTPSNPTPEIRNTSLSNEVPAASKKPTASLLETGLLDPLPDQNNPSPASAASSSDGPAVDWARSFSGLSTSPFPAEAAEILTAPLKEDDVEVKPDGVIYLPEIKYRRILNKAFGPGGWGLAPRGETIVTEKAVTREYALVILGRLVSLARGEMDYFSPEGIPTSAEGCKSNALMRCCKDLGIASELWDPRFVRSFIKRNAKEVWVEHMTTKKRRKIFMRKDDEVRPPFKESKAFGN
ncbi:hypothetical protein MMC25_004464 [Agyrium rufum]|nr:hypothetical protein [Agyrium rufum]